MSAEEERWLLDNGWTLDANNGKWINGSARVIPTGWSTGAYYSFSCALQSQLWRSRRELIGAWNEAQWVRIEPGCKMPADDQKALVVLWDGDVQRSRCREGILYDDWGYAIIPGHDALWWRPMPAAPKEAQP